MKSMVAPAFRSARAELKLSATTRDQPTRMEATSWSALAAKQALVALLFALLLAPALRADQGKPLPAIDGTLVTTGSGCPLLKTHDKVLPLSGKTSYVMHTLQDKRLDGRELHLEGIPKPDGTFEVQWIFSIHNGKLYRVRYFCKLCNIEALEPGPCACCQQPTELDEVPVDQPSR